MKITWDYIFKKLNGDDDRIIVLWLRVWWQVWYIIQAWEVILVNQRQKKQKEIRAVGQYVMLEKLAVAGGSEWMPRRLNWGNTIW